MAAKSLATKDALGLHLGANVVVINRGTGELLVGPFYFREKGKSANVDYRLGKCTQRDVTN